MRNGEILKSSPDYQKGREAGLKAEEPPRDLVEFRSGYSCYVEGLGVFLAQHKIFTTDVGIYNFPEALSSRSSLSCFVSGLRRANPGIARNYIRRHRLDELKYNYNEKLGSSRLFMFERQQMLRGYQLGFVVGIARDFDVKLQDMGIPTDDLSYQAFMDGLNAKPREMPLQRGRSIETNYFLEESPHEIYESIDTNAYSTGLQVWLTSQGLGRIQSWEIRHPEALRAFKAALDGQVLSEYEPRKAIVRMPTSRENLIKYPPEENFIEKSYYPPSPIEEARREGANGYSLGKTARLLRQALGVTAQTSSSPQ